MLCMARRAYVEEFNRSPGKPSHMTGQMKQIRSNAALCVIRDMYLAILRPDPASNLRLS
jgi:hypothetical protein